MISIIVANWNSYDWLDLLLESLDIFTKSSYKVIVVDNSINYKQIDHINVFQIINKTNIGHGQALNLGSQSHENTNPFTMFLDVDCHVLSHGWEFELIGMMDEFDVIGGKGVPQKPIRPACMFMKTEIAQKYDWCDSPGYKGHRVTPEGTDVAIRAYHQMVSDGVPIHFLDAQKNRYGTLNGEEFVLDNKPLFYHHWHGSHLHERQTDFPNDNLFEDKRLLFSQIPWRIL